ncbi:hypothetical protein EV650_7045 [Kribbella kalugense]|uniref:PH (Pleckstrin Homology) domain-containing protein n=2 Tax=Kribbella kalugense TaxID=2512221 RepID=A0A4R7ZH08_9ACTN|nr:hypothetical protein EV650_7045 [Kribbella kalugense]
MVELHRNGRVEFPLRRWAFIWLPVAPLLVMGLFGAIRLPYMLDSWRVVGWIAIAAYAGIAIVIVWQFATQRPFVVIDHNGIHRGRRRFIPWTEISSIGPLSGPKLARQFLIFPKNVRAKNLALTQQHANDLQSFRTWLEQLLAEHRGSGASGERT